MLSCEETAPAGSYPVPRQARPLAESGPAYAVAAAFAPMLVLFGQALWARPHYQFFPLVAGFALVLAIRECRMLGPVDAVRSIWLRRGAAAGWCLLAASIALVSLTGAAVAAMWTLAIGLLTAGGWRLFRACLPAWCLLWLTIPPPHGLDELLITSLQGVVSRWSSQCLDVLGIIHLMDGAVVEVAGRRLLVDQACSGIYSLLTLAIGTLCYGLWMRSSILRTGLLLAASIFWVLFGNVARVVIVVVLNVRYGYDLASGLPHELLGLAMFAVMLGLVVSTDQLLEFFASLWRWLRSFWTGRQERILRQFGYTPIAPGEGEPAGIEAEAPPPPASSEPPALPALGDSVPVTATWLGSWRAAAAFGALLIPQAMFPGVSWREQFRTGPVFAPTFAKVGEEFLPARVGPFERTVFRTEVRDMSHSLGEYSRAWVYRGLERTVVVSLDYEFADWHELTLCYQNQGWTLESVRMATAGGDVSAKPGEDLPLVSAEYKDVEGLRGSLLYGLFDRRGRPLAPPTSRGLWHDLSTRLGQWVRRDDGASRMLDRRCYQLQVFLEGGVPLRPDEQRAVRGLYEDAQKRLTTLVAGPEGTTP